MVNYVKRHWNEARSDEYAAWGTSWWYFEVAEDGWVMRQIEQYESGVTLRYDAEHQCDEFGLLCEKPLDLTEPEYCRIPPREFEASWIRAAPNNTAKPK
ncbi:MAG: hypothetical protein ACXU8N_06505 [Telluria sp.]